tara:strand:+ start:58110 stop:58853 length:744 start_codon:yes stop_codon:yes gene_type:complete
MGLESTSGIVLKTFSYGETSKIIRCYTKDFGKISLIAKGVKTSKTLQTGYLEPINCISINLYYNSKRQLQIFSKAEFDQPFLSIKSNIKKLSYSFAVIELIDKTVNGEESHHQLFNLTKNILSAINDNKGKINILFWFFQLKLLALLGFKPNLSNCSNCQDSLNSANFLSGELFCSECSNSTGIKLSKNALSLLKKINEIEINDIPKLKISIFERKEIGEFLKQYYSYHIDGLREIKSLRVMESILN